jgi:serine protease
MNKINGIQGFLTLMCLFLSLQNNALSLDSVPPATGGTGLPDNWAYRLINLVNQNHFPKKVVTVAVVDDGFRFSHKSLKPYLFKNDKEILGNYQDDDRNGHLDDIHGWDLSDNDGDVSVPKGREDLFYHGTYVAGIITSLFVEVYGEEATDFLRIIPVKVLSDKAGNTYLSDGYKGIKYASDIGADIICCAWSGGVVSEEEKTIVNNALLKGAIIIGSAGNFFTERVEFPAALPGVVSVAAVDSLGKKNKHSSFGARVDISAPGSSVYGPHPRADNSFFFESGTSPAAAIISGCMAILKSLNPSASSAEIVDALLNTASPIDTLNPTYGGKLGSGVPDMVKAMDFISNVNYKFDSFDPARPEGKIYYSRKLSPKNWKVQPSGEYRGFHLFSESSDYKGIVSISTKDSVLFSGPISEIAKGQYFPGNSFQIELESKPKPSKELEFSYYMETIDSTIMYCSGTQDVEVDFGYITDNSGDQNYANNSSCKWQIMVSPGKRIRIEFEELDTQANIDFVWLFSGNATLQENLIAKVSGSRKPPVITSLTNELLVWFVTDDTIAAQGWKLKFSAVD